MNIIPREQYKDPRWDLKGDPFKRTWRESPRDPEIGKLFYEQAAFDEQRTKTCTKIFKKGDVVRICNVIVDMMESYKERGQFIGKTFVIMFDGKIGNSYYMPDYTQITGTKKTHLNFSWHACELELFEPPKPSTSLPLACDPIKGSVTDQIDELKQLLTDLDERLKKIEFNSQ